MNSLLNEYKLKLGMMPPEPDGNRVVYAESHRDGLLEGYINDNLQLIEQTFTENGLSFIYLPEWIDDADETVLIEGCFPEAIVEEAEIKRSECIRYSVDSSPEPPKPDDNIRFRIKDDIDQKFEQLRRSVPDWVLRRILDEALQQREVVSRMVVSHQNRLILTDYDNAVIELRPLEMAFYYLYLRHPEGISFKCLADYRDELWRYYKHTAVFDDLDKMKESLERLIDPFSGSANQQRSRISKAINEAIGGRFRKEMAGYYMIIGPKGEDKKIMIPRDKIVWEVDW